MARFKQLIFDSEHPASLSRFWVAALEDFDIRPYDDEEIARLAALGFTPETDPVVILDGPMFELCFQKVDVVSTGKNPLHPDIEANDRRTEVERLLALGATVREVFEDHTWMRDPEGNDFCVTDA